MNNATTTFTLKTHRYEFSEYAVVQLNYFTQIHKYDERKAFKEAWEKWVKTDDIAEMIASETKKLISEGFQGDVEDKMFKSVRYYFRKKPSTSICLEEKKEQMPRKKYIGFTGKILTAMDKHILAKIKENMKEDKEQEETKKKHFKSNVFPDKAYNDFYNTNIDIIQEETEILQYKEKMDDVSIILKMKKTYKNRYQTIRKKLQT